MNLSIPPIITYVVSWFGLMGGVWALFDRAETVVSQESKKKVTAWIKGLEISSRKDLPQSFEDAFNAVFGRRHFSLRCIFSSCVASFGFVLILLILFISLNPQALENLQYFPSDILYIFMGAAILNLIPDYFSLLETRFILRAMTKASSTLRILILVIVDFIFSTVIITIAFVVLIVLIILDPATEMLSNAEWFETGLEWYLNGLVFRETVEESGSTMGIYIYTTYLTSFWIWLYVLALVIARILVRLEKVWSWFKGFLNFTEKPLRSLGFLSMLLVTVVYILIPLVRLL